MPTVSMFYGITIYMYKENKTKHHTPHIHAKYQGEDISVSFDGEILDGSMTNKKLKLVLAWVEIHKEDLQANWNLISEGEPIFRIDPLR